MLVVLSFFLSSGRSSLCSYMSSHSHGLHLYSCHHFFFLVTPNVVTPCETSDLDCLDIASHEIVIVKVPYWSLLYQVGSDSPGFIQYNSLQCSVFLNSPGKVKRIAKHPVELMWIRVGVVGDKLKVVVRERDVTLRS